MPHDASAQNPPAILVVGDSLSAEYGLARGTGWVALLEARLRKQGFAHRIVNASISGETSSGGAARIDRLVDQHKPAVLVIELGANDALRGLSLAATDANLTRMIRAGQRVNARVLLIGMEVPPNYGAQYTRQFRQTFETVSKREKTALVPFLLDGFATDQSLFQADRIHPNEKAQPRMLETVWPGLSRLLKN
ncbi:MAG TPA: arylesterase [Burkholderiaceae bacterium]|nr:arylesterase [Burkholderiaceae bacterium]